MSLKMSEHTNSFANNSANDVTVQQGYVQTPVIIRSTITRGRCMPAVMERARRRRRQGGERWGGWSVAWKQDPVGKQTRTIPGIPLGIILSLDY